MLYYYLLPSNINELKSDDKIIYTVDILGKTVVGQEKRI